MTYLAMSLKVIWPRWGTDEQGHGGGAHGAEVVTVF